LFQRLEKILNIQEQAGLAIWIIDNHGGYIKVQSEQGVGTEFNIFTKKNQSYFKLLFLNLD
jgi:hypothetical protein